MTVFDRAFFESLLPAQVQALDAQHPEQTPVLHMHLLDGTVLDIRQLISLADSWLSAAYFIDAANDDAVAVVFLPYSLIARLTVTLPQTAERQIGFNTTVRP